MSDLAATGCGCSGNGGILSGRGGNCSCNVLLWLLILSCACGGDRGGFFGGNGLFGGGCDDGCGDGCGCGGNSLWIIILIALLG